MNVILAYRKVTSRFQIGHIGHGLAAMNTVKVLRREGMSAEAWPISNASDLERRLRMTSADHVILAEPLASAVGLEGLAGSFPKTRFAVHFYSDLGSIPTEHKNADMIRRIVDLRSPNIGLAGSTRQFCQSIGDEFGTECSYLPNLYWIPPTYRYPERSFHGGRLRVGMFGAIRPIENVASAAKAALQIARSLGAPLDLWVSTSWPQGDNGTMLAVAHEALGGAPDVRLIPGKWGSWASFRKSIGYMHLLVQPNDSHLFDFVTADGVAEGIPSVVSIASNWTPENWKAPANDIRTMTQVGQQLLHSSSAPSHGMEALQAYVHHGKQVYHNYFAA